MDEEGQGTKEKAMSHQTIRCKHCNGPNLLPVPEPIDLQAIRAEAARKAVADFVARLLHMARDNPQRVWSRVVIMDHTINDTGPLVNLAAKLQCSIPRASRACDDARQTLNQVQLVNSAMS